ncbi:predicted protein [Plenodomus lingam JN3]|uniref:Predicted protein n=1 Tax=Leptosphaeria maculans (strain JN3 / isolate v23.1.3 / race Av1-4-5-6-7-8) TaxID=985895 RepID=E5A1I6_LEPMJ|nr:predicted protein [Plenodomus lingam JN3]CBX97450.1 predicted protein [Plenodomus lingam JN3]
MPRAEEASLCMQSVEPVEHLEGITRQKREREAQLMSTGPHGAGLAWAARRPSIV